MSSFNKNELVSRILEIHDYRGLLDFKAKPVYTIVEIIVRRAIRELPGAIQESPSYEDFVDMNALDSLSINIIELQRMIAEIYGKMCRSWLEGRDSHTTTLDILHTIERYHWDAKAVLAVATFASWVGGFHLIEQIQLVSPLAKAVSQLKPLPRGIDSDGSFKPKLEALSLLITAILNITNCTVELYEILGNEYLSGIDGFQVDIPTIVYWTIRSTVDCASQIYVLTSVGPEYIWDPWELSSTAHKLEKMRSQILDKIKFCYTYIEKKKNDEALEAITRFLESSHVDNSKSLGILFCEKDNRQQVLFDCLQHKMVSVEALKNKVVALYVTDLNFVTEDYFILQQMYPENLDDKSRIEQYEIVWLPILDTWTSEKIRQFESLRDQMEWLAVNHPSDVSPTVIRYIREKCDFVKKPRVLVMDTEGKIVHKDALSMLCIWGNRGYPFSMITEKSLWSQIRWNISLLAEGIDQFLTDWIREGKHICLYGGEDIEWIRRFTKTAKNTARESGIELELLYVGKDRARERVVKKIISAVQREKLSNVLDWKLIAYFWLRLEKMCVSQPPDNAHEIVQDETSPEFIMPDDLNIPISYKTHKNNPILSGVVKLLSFGSSGKGWAAISAGPDHSAMFEVDGETLLRALAEHGKWMDWEESYGFATALARYYHSLCNDQAHCVNMILSDTELNGISCAVCNSLMDKMVMYSCCSDRSSFGYHE